MVLTNPRIRGWKRFLAVFFGNWRPVRWFLGGHWEYWWVDPCRASMWLDVDRCSVASKDRPPACFGTPRCENHGRVQLKVRA